MKILTLCLTVGVHFSAVTFLLPVLPAWGMAGPWMETAFAFAHILALPLLGRLADRFGSRPVLFVSLLLQAGAFLLFLSSRTSGAVLTARLLSGAASAVLPVTLGWVRRNLYEESRPRAIAGLMLGVTVGAGLGSGISGWFDATRSGIPAIIMIALCLIIAVATLRLPRKRPEEPSLDDTLADRLSLLSSSRPLLIMALTFLAVSTGFHLFRTLLPFRLESPEMTGLLVTLVSLGAGIPQMFLFFRPIHASKTSRAYMLSIVGMSTALALGAPEALPFAIVAVLLLSISAGAADALGGAVLASLTSKELAGVATGAVFSVGALGKILGPLLASFVLASLTLTDGFLLALASSLIGLLLILRLVR